MFLFLYFFFLRARSGLQDVGDQSVFVVVAACCAK